MNICIATGTRAEYGLLKPLIDQICSQKDWKLQILVTGAHLSPEFGLTYKQIEKDGLKIAAKVEMLLSSDTAQGIVKSMGLGMIGFADALSNLKPDAIVILGDRYEMLALASSALIFKIPIFHIHGGEITEGAYDDAIRHSISKMSHLHFTSTADYRNRVIQLGENPNNVYNVGAIGLDNIKNVKLLSQSELEKDLDVKFLKYNYQVTFHPATLETQSVEEQFQVLLNVIDKQEDSFFIFTKANADTDGRTINRMIDEYTTKNPSSTKAVTSLGTLRFLSVLKICDAIVGNSSSGIIEAPSLKTATINIGERQKGRIQANSVLNCDVDEHQIEAAFKKVVIPAFQEQVDKSINPYGNGNTSEQIVDILKSFNPEVALIKTFHDFLNEYSS